MSKKAAAAEISEDAAMAVVLSKLNGVLTKYQSNTEGFSQCTTLCHNTSDWRWQEFH